MAYEPKSKLHNSLEELRLWHLGQACQHRKLADARDLEHPELINESMSRIASVHEAHASVLGEAIEVLEKSTQVGRGILTELVAGN